MKSSFMKFLVQSALLIGAAMQANAAKPPFKQCSPSGYNCSALVTVDRYGIITVDIDPRYNDFYPPSGIDEGRLIGFQNNSRRTVYSLSFRGLPGGSSGTAYMICYTSAAIREANPFYNPANVTIANIPSNLTYAYPPYYYYRYFPNGLPPSSPPFWWAACDVAFSGGIPPGGSAWFTLYHCFFYPPTIKDVVPFVHFQTAMAKGETASANVTLYPSPSPVTVTLDLVTTSGSGSAVFASTNSTTMTITQSGTVQIRGVEASSVAENIELRASVGGEIRSRASFTVVDKTLNCTSPVTRGQSTTCQPATAPTGGTYSWKFTDANGNVVTPNNSGPSWQGIMVTSGTVDLTINGVALTPASLTVNNRTDLAFTAVPPSQVMSNTLTCYTGPPIVLPSPPTEGSYEGFSCADMAYNWTSSQVADGGPNSGYWYVSHVSDSFSDPSGNYPTKFEYIVVSDLLNSASTFYTSQCGDFSVSNSSGFIAGSQLLQNVFNHEQGSVLSHWTEYRDAQSNPSNNIGAVLEAIIGTPGTSRAIYEVNLDNSAKAATARIEQAVGAEPCSGIVNKDSSQFCKFCGRINFSQYQSCGNSPPVPYCQ